MAKSKKKILLDADVIIHFAKGGPINLLPKIFIYPKVVLSPVLEELNKHFTLKNYYNNLIQYKLIE